SHAGPGARAYPARLPLTRGGMVLASSGAAAAFLAAPRCRAAAGAGVEASPPPGGCEDFISAAPLAPARPRRGGGALGLPRGARQGRGRGRERRQLHAAAGGGRRCDVGEGGQVLLGGGGHRWRDGGPDHLLRHGRLLRLPAGGPPPAGQGEEAAGDGLASAGRRAGTGAGRARVRGRRLCDRLHRHLAARSRARLARGDSAPLLLPSVPLWFVLAACCTPPPRPTARG
ncbi:unnamed protein product, partial [Prorocentrum cordatum]